MRPDLRGACLSASILLLVQLHSIGTKGLDGDLPTEATSDYQQNSGDETVQLDCEELEIRGSRSALSGYINGKYRVGAERMYINKHVAFKKVRGRRKLRQCRPNVHSWPLYLLLGRMLARKSRQYSYYTGVYNNQA